MSTSENRQRKSTLPPTRCYPEEEEQIRQKAADCGLSVGPFLLACGLGRQTRSHVDSQVINELRKLGGLQKHLFVQGGEVNGDKYYAVLQEIQAAVARIGRAG